MRTIRTKIYKFDELSKGAQEKAIDNNYSINTDYEWYESTYEDAENIGLKITGFDVDRGSYCKGEFMDDACYTAHKIIDEHGEECETYRTAQSFLQERDEIVNNAPKDEDGEFEDECELDQLLDEVENGFLKAICEDYLVILRNEYEYQSSREAIIETIVANELEFTKDGKPF